MHLLQMQDAFTQTVEALSALIAIIIAAFFMAAYKKYMAQTQRNDLLDHFLND